VLQAPRGMRAADLRYVRCQVGIDEINRAENYQPRGDYQARNPSDYFSR